MKNCLESYNGETGRRPIERVNEHNGKDINPHMFKGTLSGLRQFLVNESPLKMMKNAFYFTLKALFILKIFKFLS